jgi:hypothetical protein
VGLILVDQDATIADFERALLEAFRARHPGAPFIPLADRSQVSARKQYGPEWGPAHPVRPPGVRHPPPAEDLAGQVRNKRATQSVLACLETCESWACGAISS